MSAEFLKNFVESIRAVESILGDGKEVRASEQAARKIKSRKNK